MKKRMAAFFVVLAMLAAPAFAQDNSADTNMQILRDKMKADYTILVAPNMQLTDHGAKLSEAIPAAKAARYVQIESKIRRLFATSSRPIFR